MSEYRFFSGRIDPDRTVSKADDSGVDYKNNAGKMVRLTNQEVTDLCLYYRAYLLRRLWERSRAANHYRWVAEPALRSSILKSMVNSYRDGARKRACADALNALTKMGLVQCITIDHEGRMGRPPERYMLTHRGDAWLQGYNRWFENEFGEPYLREPTYATFVDENGIDKQESTKNNAVKALKKLDIQ